MADDGSALREAREAAGLSQAALARRAGLSRAVLSATEVGRHRPGVDAALALASALGRPVEVLFGGPGGARGADVGPAAGPGDLVRFGRVGERDVRVRVDAADPWARSLADARLDASGEARRIGPPPAVAPRERAVVAGCDPLLPAAAALSDGAVVDVAATSEAARGMLAAGLVHGALVHAARPRPRADERNVVRLRVGSWAVGLAVAPDGPGALPDVLELGDPVVRRAPDAAAQRAVERAAAAAGLPLPAGPVAPGHLAAARHAALAGGGTSAVTHEPAARAVGLGFVPAERHRVELWLAPEALGHRGVDVLLRLLRGPDLRARLPGADAYDLADAGAVLTTASGST